jgi:hypothetical protein
LAQTLPWRILLLQMLGGFRFSMLEQHRLAKARIQMEIHLIRSE